MLVINISFIYVFSTRRSRDKLFWGIFNTKSWFLGFVSSYSCNLPHQSNLHSSYSKVRKCNCRFYQVSLFFILILLFKQRLHFRDLLLLKPAYKLYVVCKRLERENALWKVGVYLLCLLLFVVAIVGQFDVWVIYLIAAPFCVTNSAMGWVDAFVNMVHVF